MLRHFAREGSPRHERDGASWHRLLFQTGVVSIDPGRLTTRVGIDAERG